MEQIGHCYEGLLDHGAIPIDELSVGLVGPEGGEPELTISQLDAFDNRDGLCEWLSDKTRCNKKPAALAKLLDQPVEGVDLARLRVACGHDDAVVNRVMPYWGIIRPDLRGLPVVLVPGSMFVTQTSTRRAMGAQYTTKALAEEVVQYALEPLVYEPGPQNEPDQERWELKSPGAILDMRVCDPAVGSGAILTAAGRYLADRLIESVLEHGPGEGSFALRLQDLASATPEEQTILARREVVDHCLYGVDKNPVAAEMAKLSLWLSTMARERPFTFLDHAIQVGDSLLGITDIEQLRWLHLDPPQRQGQRGFESIALDLRLKEATELARRLREMSVVTVRDATEKQRLHDELRQELSDLSVVADAVVGATLSVAAKSGESMEQRLDTQRERIRVVLDDDRSETERDAALVTLHGASTRWLRTDLPDEIPVPWDRNCLHWPISFPEVFLEADRGGFDAMIANPPFLGGKRISGAHGSAYREHLVASLAGGTTGSADLVTYFILRMCDLALLVGTLATNSVSQGDSRKVGFDRLTSAEWVIYRAIKSEPWPNEATLEISKVWLHSGSWAGVHICSGRSVRKISPALEPARRVSGNPRRLRANSGLSFQGCILASMAFVLDATEAEDLIANDVRNSSVVRSYLSGQEMNNDPRHESPRWVVDFAAMDETSARRFADPFALAEERIKPEVLAKSGYAGWADRWWQFWNPRSELRSTVDGFERVLGIATVSKTLQPAFFSCSAVPSSKVIVFGYQDDGHFGLLSSAFHWWWTLANTVTLRTDPSYSPTDVFETFAQPRPEDGPRWDAVANAGRELNEFRAELMIRTNLGLTKTYNRFHDPNEPNPDIAILREMHIVLDNAVRDAYRWSDLELEHHHWETPQGMRFTVSPDAKDEALDRLLELNHQRYAEEVAAGLHDKKARRSTKRPASTKAGEGQAELL